MNKLTFKEWSILADLETINLLEEDYEFSMARGQLRTAQSAITRLMAKLKGEGDLEAWVQSKITKAADYLDTVADQLYYGEDDTKRKEEEVKESFSPHEEAMRRSSEKLKKEKKITTAPMVMPRNAVYRPKEDPIKDTSVKEQPKPKAEEKKEPLTALQAAKLRKLEREQKKKRKKVNENLEILDANGNLFVTVVDIISGSEDKFKGFTQPITEDAVSELEIQLKKLNNTSYDSIDKLMRNIMKEHDMTAKELHNAFTKKHDKTPDEWIKELKEEKKGLWSNISSRRKRGLPRKKPGQKGYPKTLHIEEGIKQARKNVGANKCWMGKKLGNPATKIKGGKEVPNCVPIKESNEALRYCPKCKKNEMMKECRYGEGYWKMFSLPASLAPDAYDPTEMHPANEGVSFDIGAGHNAAKRSAKIRNLATGTTNPNEKSAALKKLSGPSLPLADSVIQPGQLTTEDYQRIQSSGNVYTILFSWRGRPMMNLQLFFPNMKRPSKEEVKTQVEKLYPGAVILQWHPSPTDPSKPIIVIQN
jgi:hypothetical protein